MTTLTFTANFANVRVVLAKVGAKQFWDPTVTAPATIPVGWIAAPDDGSIPSQCVQRVGAMAAAGATQRLFEWATSTDPADLVGGSALIFAADGLGRLGDLIDVYPISFLGAPCFTSGGWGRRS